MSAPDKAIPRRILDDADCIAVFPQVIKAAFGIGGRGGRGVVVCRNAGGWSAPAFLNVGGASFGLQIGAESTDYVMLFMTPESARSLLESNVKLGGSVSVAAGPVGREAEAATDLKLNAQILSYSRSKGLFAGAALEGAVIETADGDMRDVYGANGSVEIGTVWRRDRAARSNGVLENDRGLRAERRVPESNPHRACCPDEIEVRRHALLFSAHHFERHGDDVWRLRGHHHVELPFQHAFDGLAAEARGERAIVARRRASALQMAEYDVARFLACQLLELARADCAVSAQALRGRRIALRQ